MEYGIHEYFVMKDGSVVHSDFAQDNLEDNTPIKSYTVDLDTLPSYLLHADDRTLGIPILKYHHGVTIKPDWILSEAVV